MARIRTIKPEFWTSEQIVECSTNARLLFVGLWNFCDDAGRHHASAKRLKMEVFPGDCFTTEDIEKMISELIGQNLIVEYLSQGVSYWQVTGWRHQKIDRPYPSKIPSPFDEHSTIIRGTFDAHSSTEWNGMEWNGREKNPPPPPPTSPSEPAAAREEEEEEEDVFCDDEILAADKLVQFAKKIRKYTGLNNARKALEAAASHGCTVGDIRGICNHYVHQGWDDPERLYARLMNAEHGEDPAMHWPPSNNGQRKKRPANVAGR